MATHVNFLIRGVDQRHWGLKTSFEEIGRNVHAL